jgi:SEL1 protein
MNWKPGNNEKCLFCNTEIEINSDAEKIGYMMRQVNSNDAGGMNALGTFYYNGVLGLQQDQSKALVLWIRAVELGFSKSHNNLGMHYYYDETKAIEQCLLSGECQANFHLGIHHNWEKTKFHLEAAAMTENEVARNNLGEIEFDQFGNYDRTTKHWIIAASAGEYHAMYNLLGSCCGKRYG